MLRSLVAFLCIFQTILVSANEIQRSVRVSIFTLKYSGEVRSLYVEGKEGSHNEAKLSTANIIGPYDSVVKNGRVSLHNRSVNKEGKTIYPVAAQATIQPGSRELLIVLIPVKDDKSGKCYHATALNADDVHFPLGSYKIMNLTKCPLSALVGEKGRFDCHPGKSVLLNTNSWAPGEVRPVIIKYKKETWGLLTEARWSHSPTQKIFLCAYWDPSSGRVKMRSIPWQLPNNKTKKSS